MAAVRPAGWLAVVLGVALAVLDDTVRLVEDLILLPGGHSEPYLLLAVGILAGSTWSLGMVDRETIVCR